MLFSSYAAADDDAPRQPDGHTTVAAIRGRTELRQRVGTDRLHEKRLRSPAEEALGNGQRTLQAARHSHGQEQSLLTQDEAKRYFMSFAATCPTTAGELRQQLLRLEQAATATRRPLPLRTATGRTPHLQRTPHPRRRPCPSRRPFHLEQPPEALGT